MKSRIGHIYLYVSDLKKDMFPELLVEILSSYEY